MTILITGASGRIGLPVLQAISKLNEPIRLLDRCPPSKKLLKYLGDYVQGDILDYKAWQRALQEVDTVVHLAAISGNLPDALQTNVLSTHILARCAVESGVRKIVFASSNCILGHCDRQSCSRFGALYFPLDEAHPCLHEADYGLSKFLCEKVLEAAVRKSRLEIIALRLGWVWSQEQCEIRRRCANYDDSSHIDAVWGYVHERDCAEAFRLAITKTMPKKFDAMYISAKDTLSSTPSRVLAHKYFSSVTLAEEWDEDSHPSFFTWRKANKLLNYEPEHSWRDI
jgi:nucleoside-diphosphate-sugar epimerase